MDVELEKRCGILVLRENDATRLDAYGAKVRACPLTALFSRRITIERELRSFDTERLENHSHLSRDTAAEQCEHVGEARSEHCQPIEGTFYEDDLAGVTNGWLGFAEAIGKDLLGEMGVEVARRVGEATADEALRLACQVGDGEDDAVLHPFDVAAPATIQEAKVAHALAIGVREVAAQEVGFGWGVSEQCSGELGWDCAQGDVVVESLGAPCGFSVDGGGLTE